MKKIRRSLTFILAFCVISGCILPPVQDVAALSESSAPTETIAASATCKPTPVPAAETPAAATAAPTAEATAAPVADATDEPTTTPSADATAKPTAAPSADATDEPTAAPTMEATIADIPMPLDANTNSEKTRPTLTITPGIVYVPIGQAVSGNTLLSKITGTAVDQNGQSVSGVLWVIPEVNVFYCGLNSEYEFTAKFIPDDTEKYDNAYTTFVVQSKPIDTLEKISNLSYNPDTHVLSWDPVWTYTTPGTAQYVVKAYKKNIAYEVKTVDSKTTSYTFDIAEFNDYYFTVQAQARPSQNSSSFFDISEEAKTATYSYILVYINNTTYFLPSNINIQSWLSRNFPNCGGWMYSSDSGYTYLPIGEDYTIQNRHYLNCTWSLEDRVLTTYLPCNAEDLPLDLFDRYIIDSGYISVTHSIDGVDCKFDLKNEACTFRVQMLQKGYAIHLDWFANGVKIEDKDFLMPLRKTTFSTSIFTVTSSLDGVLQKNATVSPNAVLTASPNTYHYKWYLNDELKAESNSFTIPENAPDQLLRCDLYLNESDTAPYATITFITAKPFYIFVYKNATKIDTKQVAPNTPFLEWAAANYSELGKCEWSVNGELVTEDTRVTTEWSEYRIVWNMASDKVLHIYRDANADRLPDDYESIDWYNGATVEVKHTINGKPVVFSMNSKSEPISSCFDFAFYAQPENYTVLENFSSKKWFDADNKAIDIYQTAMPLKSTSYNGYTAYSVSWISSDYLTIETDFSGHMYLEGETVTVTITPNAAYKNITPVATSISGKAIPYTAGANNSYTFTMPAENVFLSAEVELYSTFNVNISPTQNGTVTADPTVPYENSTVKLNIQPDENYKLDKLTVTAENNTAVDIAGDYTFTMPSSDVNVTATFKLKYANFNVVGWNHSQSYGADTDKNFLEWAATQKHSGIPTQNCKWQVTRGQNTTAVTATTTIQPNDTYQLVWYLDQTTLHILASCNVSDLPEESSFTDFEIAAGASIRVTHSLNGANVSGDLTSNDSNISVKQFAIRYANFNSEENRPWYKADGSAAQTLSLHSAAYTSAFMLSIAPADNGTLSTDISTETTENGELRGWVKANDSVTLTLLPDDTYRLSQLLIDSEAADLSKVIQGNYSFTMPAKDISVSAAFEEIPVSFSYEGVSQTPVHLNTKFFDWAKACGYDTSKCAWRLTRLNQTTLVDADTVIQEGDAYWRFWQIADETLTIYSSCNGSDLPSTGYRRFAIAGGKDTSVSLSHTINGAPKTLTLDGASYGSGSALEIFASAQYDTENTRWYRFDADAWNMLGSNDQISLHPAVYSCEHSVVISDECADYISVSPTKYKTGDSVKLTFTPPEGMMIESITVTNASGVEISVNGTGNTRLFDMPGSNAYVTASFTQATNQSVILRLVANTEAVVSGRVDNTFLSPNNQTNLTLQLSVGTHTINNITVPDDYETPEDIRFDVAEDGSIVNVSGATDYIETSGGQTIFVFSILLQEKPFTITIPSDVNLNSSNGLTIQIGDSVKIPNGKSVQLFVRSKNAVEKGLAAGIGWLVGNGDHISYRFNSSFILNAGDQKKLELIIADGETEGLFAGEYSDTLTFMARITDANTDAITQ